MSDHQHNELSERLIDLCADYASGLHEQHELDELDQLDPDRSARQAFEAVAAELDIAFAETDPVEMPAGLEERLLASIPASGASDQPELRLVQDDQAAPLPATTQPTPSARGAWVPWLVAAASVAITAIVLLRPPSAPTPDQPIALSPQEQRDALIAAHANDENLLRYAWTPTDDPAVVGEVAGELIWDEERDEGYMTISGLQVNDPSQFQYQLWIFDASRPKGDLPQFGDAFDGLLTQRPIDGGVFDITESGEVVIPINAKLLVKQGVAFAVTVEPPGGVVVSDRSRVPLLAIPAG